MKFFWYPMVYSWLPFAEQGVVYVWNCLPISGFAEYYIIKIGCSSFLE